MIHNAHRCPGCERCLCRECHAPKPCVNRSRRFFLLGALAAPLAPKALIEPKPALVSMTYTINIEQPPVNVIPQEWTKLVATGFGGAGMWYFAQ